MSRKRTSSGRATPKGTANVVKKRVSRIETPPAADPPHAELTSKIGKQKQRVARPISHNRGNR